VRVLVVEDERKLAGILASALTAEAYEVVVATDGRDGFAHATTEAFDAVVLDLMLPGQSGLEILQALRQRRIQSPVLILTARDGVEDRVLGLDLGADDYLAKPFALPELLARVRADSIGSFVSTKVDPGTAAEPGWACLLPNGRLR
jgi:two-component system copper resistance phosphate regulon response regulator CusR